MSKVTNTFGLEELPPREIKCFEGLPNYVREGTAYELNGKHVTFETEDWRESHGTKAQIKGWEDNDVEVYGYPVLIAFPKLLLEVWNDEELNCWTEYDFTTEKLSFIRRKELSGYIGTYGVDKRLLMEYLAEITPVFGTAALKVCHYYFQSDRDIDDAFLESKCDIISDPIKRWNRIRKYSHQFLRGYTNHGIVRCGFILDEAYRKYFKDTSLEPTLAAECDIIWRIVSGWGGKLKYILHDHGRRYQPILETLYRVADSDIRQTPAWKIIMGRGYGGLFFNLIFRRIYNQPSPTIRGCFKDLQLHREKFVNEKPLIDIFFQEVLKSDLLEEEERNLLDDI
ncbi:MAG: hypothetical protein KC900_08845 [Candidatus Omnitrophica bacterium]|nr:hypothetical protein [Candidatus Omnitrophota bacterium]